MVASNCIWFTDPNGIESTKSVRPIKNTSDIYTHYRCSFNMQNKIKILRKYNRTDNKYITDI